MYCRNKNSKDLIKLLIIAITVILICNLIIHNSSVFYRKDIELPFSTHLNRQDLVLVKGEEFRLFVYGINIRVSYYSTNFRVAGVNFNGRVRAHQTGKAFIVAKVGEKELKCRVRVIDINKESLTLKAGDTYRLKISGIFALPRWKSSNPNVASVNFFGKIKAKNKGKTIISAKVKGKIVKCSVTIK